MAEGLLCLSVDPIRALATSGLQHATQEAGWAAEGGTVDMDDTEEPWDHCFAQVRGGPFDGLRVVGIGPNKKTRERAAHMAVSAACLARNHVPSSMVTPRRFGVQWSISCSGRLSSSVVTPLGRRESRPVIPWELPKRMR